MNLKYQNVRRPVDTDLVRYAVPFAPPYQLGWGSSSPSILIAPPRSVGDKGPGGLTRGPVKSPRGINISFKKKIGILIFIKAEILSITKTQK